MSRIAISCIILAICVYSGCFAFTVNIVDRAEQEQSEFDAPYGGERHKRMSLGTKLGMAECSHIGRTCAVQRNDDTNPTSVTIQPCCEHLVCLGIGPTERRNGLGQAHSSDGNYLTGICSLSLDNNQAYRDHDTYVEYVKGL